MSALRSAIRARVEQDAELTEISPPWARDPEDPFCRSAAPHTITPDLPKVEEARLAHPEFSPIFDGQQLLTTTTEEYLIKGLLKRTRKNMLVAPSRSGKTALLLNMSYSLACGVSFFGLETMQGSVAYLAAEGNEGFPGRVAAVRRQFLSDERRTVPFSWLPCEGDEGLHLIDDPDKIIRAAEACAKEIARNGHDPQLCLLVLDIWERFTAGMDENSGKDVGRALNGVEKVSKAMGCPVLIPHHPSAATEKNCILGKKARPRGHTSLYGNLDSCLFIAGDPDKGFDRTLGIAKFKDGDESLRIRFRIKEAHGSIIVAPSEPISGGGLAPGRGGAMDPQEDAQAAPKEPVKLEARIYKLLKRRPGLSVREIAKALKGAPHYSTVARLMKKMKNLRQDEKGHYFIKERAEKTAENGCCMQQKALQEKSARATHKS